jgi:hypothetical protein
MQVFFARVEAVRLHWDKVDNMRVQESVAELMKTVAKGMDIAARCVLCPFTRTGFTTP